MNKAAYLFFDNVMNSQLGESGHALELIQRMFEQYRHTDPAGLFSNPEEEKQMNEQLFGKDFWKMLSDLDDELMKERKKAE